jgi:CheY-like chemotaxis protein
MATQLRKAKCIVHVANHGADALGFLTKTTFAKGCGPFATPLSIVLMDLEMPVMVCAQFHIIVLSHLNLMLKKLKDGLTCVRKIRQMQDTRELTRPVPVIAVS